MSKNKSAFCPRNILITGCSSGIGLETARILHNRGHHVLATVRKPADQNLLVEAGIFTTVCDLDDSESIQAAVESALIQFDGRIDVLFNNAAYGQPGAVEDLSREALRQQFETNVFGTQELTNLVLKPMRKQRFGRIIYNSSVLGLVALPYRGAYNASKYALEGLADTLRLELHGTGIDISLIEPGPITSNFRQNAFSKYQQYIDKKTSHHRDRYLAMEKRLLTSGPAAPFTLPASAVANKVVHAVEASHPNIRYYVTFPTYLFGYLKRILSAQLLDWLLLRISRKEGQ